MTLLRILAATVAFAAALSAGAQQASQPQLKIDSTNRTLTVTADAHVSVEPEVAILHIGFETQPSDAKTAYADGARTSNAIVDALKQAGIPESDHPQRVAVPRARTTPLPSRTSSSWRSSGP